MFSFLWNLYFFLQIKSKIIMGLLIAFIPQFGLLKHARILTYSEYFISSFYSEIKYANFDKSKLELSVTTDKSSYYIGEPIVLRVVLQNKSDKELDIAYRKYNRIHVSVLFPNETEWRKIDPTGIFLEHRKHPEQLKHFTRLARNWSPWDGFKNWTIYPGKSLVEQEFISSLFDMTLPEGKYKIRVSYPLYKDGGFKRLFDTYCEFEQEISVQIKDSPISSAGITADTFVRMLGKKKAMELLSEEADELLTALTVGTNGNLQASSEYQRLLLLFRTMGDVAGFGWEEKLTRLEEENKITSADLREFIQQCRAEVEADTRDQEQKQ